MTVCHGSVTSSGQMRGICGNRRAGPAAPTLTRCRTDPLREALLRPPPRPIFLPAPGAPSMGVTRGPLFRDRPQSQHDRPFAYP